MHVCARAVCMSVCVCVCVCVCVYESVLFVCLFVVWLLRTYVTGQVFFHCSCFLLFLCAQVVVHDRFVYLIRANGTE